MSITFILHISFFEQTFSFSFSLDLAFVQTLSSQRGFDRAGMLRCERHGIVEVEIVLCGWWGRGGDLGGRGGV